MVNKTIKSIYSDSISNTQNKPVSVLAIMTVFNESDIIEQVLLKLLKQGIDVHIIDNWSTDGSYETLKQFSTKYQRFSFERFPASGPSETYNWKILLKRVEQIASSSTHNWIIHHDADEVRVSCWKDLSLKEGIQRVDREGYNAIDFAVMDFRPTKNGFKKGVNPESFFNHFEMGSQPGNFVQIKTWKNVGQHIDLASSGGHEVYFHNRRIYPIKFITKHYSFRALMQLKNKLDVRKKRILASELSMGWHRHSLTIRPQLWSALELFLFNKSKFNYASFKQNDTVEMFFNKNNEISLYIQHLHHLQNSLATIQNSKFYKLWQYYNRLKKQIFGGGI